MHTVVLKEELVTQHPWLPRSLYDAFTEAKRLAYERLHFTAALLTSLPWQVAEAEETRALMGDDPFAYGIARNRTTAETPDHRGDVRPVAAGYVVRAAAPAAPAASAGRIELRRARLNWRFVESV